MRRPIIAVDFDNTIAHSVEPFPDIGEPIKGAITCINGWKQRGAIVVLWTCRDGVALSKAVSWCRERNLLFDATNVTPFEIMDLEITTNSAKMYANVYIDDKALGVPKLAKAVDWDLVETRMDLWLDAWWEKEAHDQVR